MFRYYIEPKVIPDFLTEDEIEYIKKKSINNLSPSVIDESYNNKNIRDSDSTWLDLDDPIVSRVVRRCVGLTNKPFTNCEMLHVVRYKSGGFYKPHQDVAPIIFGNNSNIRLYTILISLNDDYEGGETSFPNLGIKYKLKKGSLLFFHTVDNNELETSLALHSGQPVKSGEKWICNLWVHKYPYT